MNSFETAGEAMLAAQEGQAQLARALNAAIGRGLRRLGAWVVTLLSKAPPSDAHVG